MEGITDTDYSHVKRVCKDFENVQENIIICMFNAIH